MVMGNLSGDSRRADLVHHHLHPPTRAIITMPAHHRGMRTPLIIKEEGEEEAGVGMMKDTMTINPLQTICPLGDRHTMEVGGTRTTVDTITTILPRGCPEGMR